ncbi:MAG: phosphoesterase [Patescibacteria group bacterium]|nr:phosphoesterase [Patescibacteria group bacterium]MDE1944339.1 phosphoesterase [Patescibacteria group bacterium]MDE1945333.1 phosphoesterase [Patescibacteria group bacterium]MDE2057689.1 phosphoesterase [Patescibacteria group bacterium]
MEDKRIVVIYHKRCPDGFGAAYAAWKKFGDAAEYLPAGYGDDLPEGLAGKEVYLLDFTYERPGELDALAKEAARLVVLDHHESSRGVTERAPEHVYDAERSGATIAWSYFHPEAPMPQLFRYLEDGDLYRFALPETRALFTYLITAPYDFAAWDEIAAALEDPARRDAFFAKAAAYDEQYEKLCAVAVEAAKRVEFEGYECYFANSLPSITMRSRIAALLCEKLPPIALVVSAHPDGYGVSIRSDGSADVATIAAKFGGGGHASSAGFFIPNGHPMPWHEVEED